VIVPTESIRVVSMGRQADSIDPPADTPVTEGETNA
jgi:hypothetical protein